MADTLEELAEQIGVPYDTLQKTVDEFNTGQNSITKNGKWTSAITMSALPVLRKRSTPVSMAKVLPSICKSMYH